LYSNIGGAGGNLLLNNDNELFANQLKVDDNKDDVVIPDPGPKSDALPLEVIQEENKTEQKV
jgi:hypothetical protein